MTASNKSTCFKTVAFACVMMLAAGVLHAALPSTVSYRVKKINTALDQAEKALDAGQKTSAERKLAEAQRAHKEILDRYAGKFAEDDPEYKAAAERLASVTGKVEALGKAAAGEAEAKQKAEAENKALCKQWIDKLHPFTDYKSDQYLRVGSDLNSASPEDQAKSRAAYAEAKALFAEYQKTEFPLGKTMELRNVESTLASTMKYYGRDETDAAQEAACKEWVDKLAPYVEVGMHSDKYLIASPTANAEQLKTQQALYGEAKTLFGEYQKARFPEGKTGRLQSLEEQMAKTLEEFPEAISQSKAMMSGDVGKRLDAILASLDRDTSWKSDTTKKPATVMDRDLAPLREEVDKFATTVKAGDPKLAELKAKLKAVESKDAEHRAVRAQRTFQSPDGYSGADVDALKAKAREVAAAAHPGGRILGVTVPSKEWAVEDVVEHTDTTRSAIRHRITRSVRSQVVVKDAKASVWLQEVYLGQDKQPDGGWGPIKGHTTWADRMAEENVGKKGP